jgi:hypothetical protein
MLDQPLYRPPQVSRVFSRPKIRMHFFYALTRCLRANFKRFNPCASLRARSSARQPRAGQLIDWTDLDADGRSIRFRQPSITSTFWTAWTTWTVRSLLQKKGRYIEGRVAGRSMQRTHGDADWPGLVGRGEKYADREQAIAVWRVRNSSGWVHAVCTAIDVM